MTELTTSQEVNERNSPHPKPTVGDPSILWRTMHANEPKTPTD